MNMGGDAPTRVINYDARRLYQTQDNLKAVVDFMANSIAQLPLKAYRRDGETERVRDRDSTAAKLLWRPNRDQTWFEFIRGLSTEYFIFGSVYAWLLPDPDAPSGYQLRIIPSEWVMNTEGDTVYAPAVIRVQANGGTSYIDIPRDEFVLFISAEDTDAFKRLDEALRLIPTLYFESGKSILEVNVGRSDFGETCEIERLLEQSTDRMKRGNKL